ncbi:radical SAM protein [Candidatus Omnitrophota bacterium]
MKKLQSGRFFYRLLNKRESHPFSGHIELTYRCNLNCIHCYSKGLEEKEKELSTSEWKRILDLLQKQGCFSLCFTGGEPLVRDDFLEIYAYAKKKGFMVTLFTNAQALTSEVIDFLLKFPPFSIEITLNGITKKTYESITRVPGSFLKAMKAIQALKEKKLPLILKSNCLKQNKHEIGKIKAFADDFLGKQNGKYHFKYDPLIYPKFNRDKTPTNYRLSFSEILKVKKQDPDFWEEYKSSLDCKFPRLKRRADYLYNCTAWRQEFFINPYGRLRFCDLSDRFSVDLKIQSFKKGFYKVFPQVLNARFKTDSKCRTCRLRPLCYYCPARAYLETGDQEAPVPYYCQLAEATAKEMSRKS